MRYISFRLSPFGVNAFGIYSFRYILKMATALELQPPSPTTFKLYSTLSLSATVVGWSVADDVSMAEGVQVYEAYCPTMLALSFTCVPGATRVSLGYKEIRGDGLMCILTSGEITVLLAHTGPLVVRRQVITSFSSSVELV